VKAKTVLDFGGFMTVTMKSTDFWVSAAPRCFGGTYRLHFHGQREQTMQETSRSRRKDEISVRYVPPKRRTHSQLHGVTTQNTVLLHENSSVRIKELYNKPRPFSVQFTVLGNEQAGVAVTR
jgi:hypothetical protein